MGVLSILNGFLPIVLNASPSRAVLICGAGRSGTTWFARSLCALTNSRLIYEPFSVSQIPAYSRFHIRQHYPPDSGAAELKTYVNVVLTGKIHGKWVDRYRNVLFDSRRIVKAIGANLFLGWLRRNYTSLKIIYLIRDPIAVAVSRKRCGWNSALQLADLIDQNLIDASVLKSQLDIDFLNSPPLLQHIAVWAIENMIALRELSLDSAIFVFYEDLHSSCSEVMHRIISHFGGDGLWPLIGRDDILPILISSDLGPDCSLRSSSSELTLGQYTMMNRILSYFGLSDIYNENGEPSRKNLYNIISHG